ncbi:putative galacturan 1,4-alpha-galacturonidase [Lupinus albus]|uniref:Putative galacturan 1,4-alpha-galacturonidase n=1 Tax=Lupinus albus TaxID=3870 RepID=A0A6A4PAR2_LUPAL|nr:putative galacturan 1,4-alpha-galacturonidase [Lupinus albus]
MQPSLVKISNIVFSNVRGTTLTPIAVDLRCSKLFPCRNVRISNINLKHASIPISSRCANIKPVYTGVQHPPAC